MLSGFQTTIIIGGNFTTFFTSIHSNFNVSSKTVDAQMNLRVDLSSCGIKFFLCGYDSAGNGM